MTDPYTIQNFQICCVFSPHYKRMVIFG